MDTWALVVMGLLLIWLGYDFIVHKAVMLRWASVRNLGKIVPRTPARDRRSNSIGAGFILAGLVMLILAGWRLV